MELRDIAHIVGRHKILATVGILLAVALGVLTFVATDNHKYESTTTVFLTEQGFPYTSPASGSGVPV